MKKLVLHSMLLGCLVLTACGGGGGGVGGTGGDDNSGSINGSNGDPSVPTGLTATIISPTVVNLSWNPSSDNGIVMGYYAGANNEIPVFSLDTYHSFTNLTPNTQYCITVYAIDNEGNSSASCSAVCVSTPATAANPWVAVRQGIDDPLANIVWNGTKALVVANGFRSTSVMVSNDGYSWDVYPASGFGFNSAIDVAYGNGKYVALDSLIYTSLDGIAWSYSLSGPSDLNAIAWSPELLEFVAVGEAGAIYTSPNGTSWTAVAQGLTSIDLYGVASLNGKLIAVGDEETILTSDNGTDWVQAFQAPPVVLPAYNHRLETLSWNGKQGQESIYLLMGYSTAYISSDCITWNNVATAPLGSNDAVVWGGGSANGFVVVGRDGHMYFSADGKAWTKPYLPTAPYRTSADIHDITWTGSRFVAVGGTGMVITSTDGLTWEILASGEDFTSVIWDGTQYLATANNGRMARAATPTDWSYLFMGSDDFFPTDIARNNDYILTVGAGSGVYSSDLATWYGYLSFPQSKNSVIWDGNRFVMTSVLGIKVWDGIPVSNSPIWSWSLYSDNPKITMFGIHWDGSLLVAVGKGGLIYTSTDSTVNSPSWAMRTSGATADLLAVTKGGSRYVAVGAAGTIITSDNGGVSWTSRSSGTTSDLNDVTWTGTEFIAVGIMGAIVRSLDGITWSYFKYGYVGLNSVVSHGSDVVIVGTEGLIVRKN